jgi:hypothetical protein
MARTTPYLALRKAVRDFVTAHARRKTVTSLTITPGAGDLWHATRERVLAAQACGYEALLVPSVDGTKIVLQFREVVVLPHDLEYL